MNLKIREAIDMLLGDEIEREMCISEFLGDCPKNYIDKSIKFTLKQWNIIQELLHRENIVLRDRCKNCEQVLRDKHNGGISSGDFFGEISQIYLKQLYRKKEIEKILKKLGSEEL